jgi:hypothetical protein
MKSDSGGTRKAVAIGAMVLIVLVIVVLAAIGGGQFSDGAADARRVALSVGLVLTLAAPIWLIVNIATQHGVSGNKSRLAWLTIATLLLAWGSVSQLLNATPSQDIAEGLAIIVGYCAALVAVCSTPAELFQSKRASAAESGGLDGRRGALVGIVIAVLSVLVLYIASAPGTDSSLRSAPEKPVNFPQSQLVIGPLIAGAPAVGACGALSGSAANSRFDPESCDSERANFKVVQVASEPGACSSDVDQRYYHSAESGSWAACLDYNWTADKCLHIQGWNVSVVDCGRKIKGSERLTQVLVGNVAPSVCESGGGYPHPKRQFTVCTELLK